MTQFNPSKDDLIYHYKDYIQHIQWLMEGMASVQHELMRRMLTHDRTKIGEDELDAYAEIVPGFKDYEYGTPEHKAHGNRLGPAWKHHTENNRHHTEHFENGLNDMNLLDLIEMVCDWRAASMRSGNFDYGQSLRVFKERVNPDEQVMDIIRNTCIMLSYIVEPMPESQKDLP